MDSALSWQPIYRVIEDAAASGNQLTWIAVPFIKLDALKRLIGSIGNSDQLTVIARWRPADLTSGVSDLEVYPFLQSRGIRLFANWSLHMKLYVLSSNWAVATSGNLTLSGLGYSDSPNIEVANRLKLMTGDWIKLHALANDSRLITQDIFERYKKFVDDNPPAVPPLAPKAFDLLGPARPYTLAALPATETPETLMDFYFGQLPPDEITPDFSRRAYHDLAAYGGGFSFDTRSDLNLRLKSNFCNNPFVIDFVDYLRITKSLRFGAVNEWIHKKCDDVPLPYRWEIKAVTRCFYNWLDYYFDEISWDRPRHSQIIYWQA